jgi:hypothetical protein
MLRLGVLFSLFDLCALCPVCPMWPVWLLPSVAYRTAIPYG